jgi:hypothetical protein
MPVELESQQRELCREPRVDFVPAPAHINSGFAGATLGRSPLNGLRHPSTADTTGWYVWCGEVLSSDPDFFKPLDTQHLYDQFPEVAVLFGLPPGYRFLKAGDYLDIWFDRSLLAVGVQE